MTQLTKTEFCNTWTISRPTLDEWIKDGKISVEKDPTGRTKIDAAEALRLGLTARPTEDGKKTAVEVSQASELRSTKGQIELLERLIEAKEAELQRALADKEQYRKEAERVRLLEDQRDQAVIEASKAKQAITVAEERRKVVNQQVARLADAFEKRAAESAAKQRNLQSELEDTKVKAEEATELAQQKRQLEAKIAMLEERGLIARLFNWKI